MLRPLSLAVLLAAACGSEASEPASAGAAEAGAGESGVGDSGAGDGGAAQADGSQPSWRPLRLADVLAPVSASDLASTKAHWAARDLSAHDVRQEAEGSVVLGTVAMRYRVLSHTVEGQRHYGAVLVPTEAPAGSKLPVLVYTHGGYTGSEGLPPYRVEDLQHVVPGQPLRAQLAYVVPSYRGERIEVGGQRFTSEGAPRIGDTDVADVATLLGVALESTPEADSEHVAVLGESRGGLVALALAAHDARIDLVLDAYGPTDFRIALGAIDEATFLGSVRMALAAPEDPQHLVVRSLLPLERLRVGAGDSLEIDDPGFAEMRRRMCATSAIGQASLLPSTQVHHGVNDTTASVEYSRRLRDAMQAIGRSSPSDSFSYYEYPEGEHSLASLPGSSARIAEAIQRALFP